MIATEKNRPHTEQEKPTRVMINQVLRVHDHQREDLDRLITALIESDGD